MYNTVSKRCTTKCCSNNIQTPKLCFEPEYERHRRHSSTHLIQTCLMCSHQESPSVRLFSLIWTKSGLYYFHFVRFSQRLLSIFGKKRGRKMINRAIKLLSMFYLIMRLINFLPIGTGLWIGYDFITITTCCSSVSYTKGIIFTTDPSNGGSWSE